MHHACMPTVTIRNVPEALHRDLLEEAKAEGKSLQEFLMGLMLNHAKRRLNEDVLEEIKAYRAEHSINVPIESILANKDADKR